MNRRQFAWLIGGGFGALAGWWWLTTRSASDGIAWPFRWMHRLNESIGKAIFRPAKLAPEFAPALAQEPRVNGMHGQPQAALPAQLKVTLPGQASMQWKLADLVAGLTRVEMTTELKCIEGWSEIVTWSGYRLADVMQKHSWPTELPYLALNTADREYYVGLDMASALHPQTLLCDQMNGEPLTAGHGAPLRLVTTVKYGIKNIKWLAGLEIKAERPADYWAERGYDWYAGH